MTCAQVSSESGEVLRVRDSYKNLFFIPYTQLRYAMVNESEEVLAVETTRATITIRGKALAKLGEWIASRRCSAVSPSDRNIPQNENAPFIESIEIEELD